MTSPKITCVIPHKNRFESLERAIKSSLSVQQIAHVLVIDDKSTVLPTQGIRDLEKEFEGRLVIRPNSSPISGAQSSRAQGIELANTDWILFLDSDDELLEPGVTTLIEMACQSNADVAYGRIIKENGKVTKPLKLNGNPYKILLRELSLVPFSGLLVRNERARSVKFNLNQVSWQDDDFILSLAKSGAIFLHCDSFVAKMSRGNNSISSNYSRLHLGLSQLLHTWEKEICHYQGVFYYTLWKARLRRLKVLGVIQDRLVGLGCLGSSVHKFLILISMIPFKLFFRRIFN